MLACTITCIFCIYRTYILDVFTFLVRQRVMATGSAGNGHTYMCWSVCGLWSLSARETNRTRAPEKARGTVWNILFASLPGSTPIASGGASLCSHIMTSPHQVLSAPTPTHPTIYCHNLEKVDRKKRREKLNQVKHKINVVPI